MLAAIRYGLFNLVSMHTDIGFATADFDRWPFLALAAIVVGTFIGGSAGSTTGGIKVARVLLAAKILMVEVRKAFRPELVKPVRIGNRTLDTDEQVTVLVTTACYCAKSGDPDTPKRCTSSAFTWPIYARRSRKSQPSRGIS